MYRLQKYLAKKLRVKTSVKKKKPSNKKASDAVLERVLNNFKIFIKDTHDTFTRPAYVSSKKLILPLLSNAHSKLKPIFSASAHTLRPLKEKLSSLPHLALIAAILTPLLSTIILEIHSSRLYKVVETEQLLLSKTTVKKDLIKDTQDAITTIIGNSIKILFNMLHVLGMEVHLKNGRI